MKEERGYGERPTVTLSPSLLPPLHPLFVVSFSLSLFFLAFTLFVLHYARRHRRRRRLCRLPHAMVATLLPEQLLSSVGFIDNSRRSNDFADGETITTELLTRGKEGARSFFFLISRVRV